MRIRSLSVSEMAEAARLYLGYRARRPVDSVRPLLEPVAGRDRLSVQERRMALAVDNSLRRLGVRCLARATVVGQMLRARGVAARVSLSVSGADPRHAHAEVEVDGRTLRPVPHQSVTLR